MQRILTLYLCLFSAGLSFGCDVCGATNSIAGFGAYSNGNRTNIGLNYQFKTYRSTHPPLFNEPAATSKELFQRLELKLQLRLSKRFQLQLGIPVTFNQQQKDGIKQRLTGLSDATGSLHYFLINRKDTLNNTTFRWVIGAGMKCPTGKFTHPDSSDLMLFGGSGSWDVFGSNLLYFQYKKWTYIWETMGFIRSQNKYNYQAGHTLSSSLLVNRNLGDWSIYGGVQYSFVGSDYKNRTVVQESPTVGSILTNMYGFTYLFSDFLIQGAYHIPLYQHLGNGYTKQKQAFSLSLYYFI